MKERCQCGKPDIPIIDSLLGVEIGKCHVLHFKAADRYCERCGAALCEECSRKFLIYIGNGMYQRPVPFTYLCHTCAELQEE